MAPAYARRKRDVGLPCPETCCAFGNPEQDSSRATMESSGASLALPLHLAGPTGTGSPCCGLRPEPQHGALTRSFHANFFESLRLAPQRKSVRLEAPRLTRIARRCVAGSGRNLIAGPGRTSYAVYGRRTIQLSSRSSTTCGSLRLGPSLPLQALLRQATLSELHGSRLTSRHRCG
jgi:hypothetical protein